MRNISFVNCLGSSCYVDSECRERVTTFAKNLPDIHRVVFLREKPEENEASQNICYRPYWNLETLVETLLKESEGFDHLFYFFEDCPLLDLSLAQTMYQSHLRYFAEYSFADGYPFGLAPEIIDLEILPALHQLASRHKETPLDRRGLFSLIEKEINSFDVETTVAPDDMRGLRLSLRLDSHFNALLVKRLLKEAGDEISEIPKTIRSKPQLLRVVPAHYQIQITDRASQICQYSPFSQMGGDILNNEKWMSLKQYRFLLGEISRLSHQATISISAWAGEAVLHPQIMQFIEETFAYQGVSLLIETSGVGWPSDLLETLTRKNFSNLRWIVFLDALDRGVYRQLRGEGYDEAYETAMRLLKAFPDRTWVQATRLKENEEDLEPFYRFWKKHTDHIIIQKYDWFCGYLPQKKVTDLSPIKRFPCWRLKRDMFITVDGNVPLCSEDLFQNYLLGNAFKEDLALIWERGNSFYHRHLEKDYSGLCERCDEYYTFNF